MWESVFKTMPCFFSEENWAKEHGRDVTIWHGEDDEMLGNDFWSEIMNDLIAVLARDKLD